MSDRDEEQRRRTRFAMAEKFAEEVSTWTAKKLRMTYAQPEAVRQAEERERIQAFARGHKPTTD